MPRSRVKLDLGPHGKVLASVLDFDDAKAVAAGRFNVESSSLQLYVSDGEDLWELHPSAFQDVVAENGVIVAKVLARPPSPAVQPPAAAAARSTIVTKQDLSRLEAAVPPPSSSSLTSIPSATATSTRRIAHAGPTNSNILQLTPSARSSRLRASSVASTSSTDSTSTSATSASSSSSSSLPSSSSSSSSLSSSSPSSSSNEDRRSESVQDVTATSASVRTFISPNGLPVSSKERWDPKTHRLMFEKLNEIISSETIYYTRKYTEERHRIFQLLIDNYGDMGIKGNFLRGRTAAALISRVAGVLRTARERGEKIKQPFKFFFPNKKDDDVAPRSATAPVASAASISNGRNRAAPRQNGDASPAQTLPANGQPGAKRKSKAARAATKRAAAAAEASGLAQEAATASQAPTASVAAALSAQAKGKGKGKAKGKQKVQRQTHGNPPEIRKRTANAASAPPTSSPAHRGAKRPANGQATTTTPPHSKKQRAPNKQPRPPIASTRPTQQRQDTSADRSQGDRTARQPSHRAALSSRRSRSTSPRPSDDQNYSNRPRGRSPRRGGDSWIRARDQEPYGDFSRDDGDDRPSWRSSASLSRRTSWTDRADQHEAVDHRPTTPLSSRSSGEEGRDSSRLDNALFRAETRSPPPSSAGHSHSTPRGPRRWGRTSSPNASASSQSSPTTRRNAVERALEHLVSVGADPSSLRENIRGQQEQNRRWGSPNRPWNRNHQESSTDARRDTPDLRRSVTRQQYHDQQQHEVSH